MRTQFSKFALAATFGLALALTFSCSSDDNEGNNVSSSSVMSGGNSSSSIGNSSESSSSVTGNGGSSSSSVMGGGWLTCEELGLHEDMCKNKYKAEEDNCNLNPNLGQACWDAVDVKLNECYAEACNGTQEDECMAHYKSIGCF